MKAFVIVICVFFLAIASQPAQSQQVLQCTEKMPPFADNLLQRAVDQLKVAYPGISFRADDQPCRQAKYTLNALTRTLSQNHLKNVSGYEYVMILNGVDYGYFTVERIKSRDIKALQRLEAALKACRNCTLKIEAGTHLEYFFTEDSIVLMISSFLGAEDNSKMFQRVRQSFLLPTSTKR